jgi:hypothetical protein
VWGMRCHEAANCGDVPSEVARSEPGERGTEKGLKAAGDGDARLADDIELAIIGCK